MASCISSFIPFVSCSPMVFYDHNNVKSCYPSRSNSNSSVTDFSSIHEKNFIWCTVLGSTIGTYMGHECMRFITLKRRASLLDSCLVLCTVSVGTWNCTIVLVAITKRSNSISTEKLRSIIHIASSEKEAAEWNKVQLVEVIVSKVTTDTSTTKWCKQNKLQNISHLICR